MSTSVPLRDSQIGSPTEDATSVPVVITSGPASDGVATDLACTTPMLTVPVAPLIESRSASYSAHSRLTPAGAGTAAAPKSLLVQSRHDSSFLGASTGGGPVGACVDCGSPWGRAPESVA